MANYSVKELTRLAKRCLDEQDIDGAIQFYSQALQLEPNNTKIMDALGEVFLEAGMPDQAREVRSGCCLGYSAIGYHLYRFVLSV